VHRALVQKLEIATELRGWVGGFRDPALYDVSLTARGEHTAAELLAAFDLEVAKLRDEPVTDLELEKAKSRLELGTVQTLETVSGKAETIGFHETVLGDPNALFSKLDAYRRVSQSDVLRVARRYLLPSARTIIEVHPSGESGDVEGDGDAEVAA
jgi:zinc protease